jgi:hypothetical protein
MHDGLRHHYNSLRADMQILIGNWRSAAALDLALDKPCRWFRQLRQCIHCGKVQERVSEHSWMRAVGYKWGPVDRAMLRRVGAQRVCEENGSINGRIEAATVKQPTITPPALLTKKHQETINKFVEDRVAEFIEKPPQHVDELLKTALHAVLGLKQDKWNGTIEINTGDRHPSL